MNEATFAKEIAKELLFASGQAQYALAQIQVLLGMEGQPIDAVVREVRDLRKAFDSEGWAMDHPGALVRHLRYLQGQLQQAQKDANSWVASERHALARYEQATGKKRYSYEALVDRLLELEAER